MCYLLNILQYTILIITSQVMYYYLYVTDEENILADCFSVP